MSLGTYTAPKRPYKLVWTDSCRHRQSFATLDAAIDYARKAEPCQIVPCAWEVRHNGLRVAEGRGPNGGRV